MIVVALLLGAIYVYSFTDWFRAPEKVKILAMARPTNIGGRPVKPNQVLPVTFAFNRKVRLIEAKCRGGRREDQPFSSTRCGT